MPKLRLYQTETCSYCWVVRNAAARLGVDLELRDVDREGSLRRMLVARRGRGTVPVLGIPEGEGEKLLGESADIVRYLERFVADESRRRES